MEFISDGFNITISKCLREVGLTKQRLDSGGVTKGKQ